eukprot:7421262-Heterocapsa_arctica.AAC.1
MIANVGIPAERWKPAARWKNSAKKTLPVGLRSSAECGENTVSVRAWDPMRPARALRVGEFPKRGLEVGKGGAHGQDCQAKG